MKSAGGLPALFDIVMKPDISFCYSKTGNLNSWAIVSIQTFMITLWSTQSSAKRTSESKNSLHKPIEIWASIFIPKRRCVKTWY